MDEYTGDQSPAHHWLSYALCRQFPAKFQRLLRQSLNSPDALANFLISNSVRLTGDASPANTEFSALLPALLAERQSASVKKRVHLALDWASKPGHHLICLDDPRYPPNLLATGNAPAVLYVRGNPDVLCTPCVAMVGARKASHAALEHAHDIAQALCAAGITVVSGLAHGIDGAAHRGALAANGQTIAVAATAPDRVYPAAHHTLATQLIEQGAVITEFPLGANLRPGCFPRRNRIISGLSLGVLVVEAALPSGSLTTAEHALRQGREVMAMPGSVSNVTARGCHHLLKNGAALVESADDVIATLATELSRFTRAGVGDTANAQGTKTAAKSASNRQNQQEMPIHDPDALTLLDCLGFDQASIDTLVIRSGLDPSRVAGALTYLELAGAVAAESGGRYARCKPIEATG